MQTEKSETLITAYECFSRGKPSDAKTLIEVELHRTLDNKEVIFSLKCANYWIEVFNRSTLISDRFQTGELLLIEWRRFVTFIGESEKTYPQVVFAIKKGIFSIAIENYQSVINQKERSLKSEILTRLGICNKALGDYENAIRFFHDANATNNNCSPIIANLADCYALCGEEKTAKVLFREAFFINPQEIDYTFLESELFLTLEEHTKNKGISGSALKEWIPVYGVLFGVFNIKRELRALEAGKLRQGIFALENEIKNPTAQKELLTPRLINHYFWLIDHYIATTSERSKINELLIKIKLLDQDVYDLYTV